MADDDDVELALIVAALGSVDIFFFIFIYSLKIVKQGIWVVSHGM